MGVDLTGIESGESMRFTVFCWGKILDLAQMYGWRPAGTQQPANWEEEGRSWNPGNYVTNDGQVVTDDDARNMAAALERSLDDIPNHYAAEHKRKEVWSDSGGTASILPSNAISPLEALSGENKDSVREFISFARKGAFRIW